MYHAGFEIKNFMKFLSKRLVRLEPPYIFSILLTLLMLYVRENLFGKENTHIHLSAAQIMLHFGYLIPFFENYDWINPVYWTLAIEFQYYIIIGLLFIPMLRADRLQRSILFAVLLGLSFISDPRFITHWFPFFLLGVLLFLYICQKISTTEFFVWQMLTLSICLFSFPFMATICAIIPVSLVLWKKDLKVPVLNWVGKFSYSIYLIHPIIGSTFVNHFSHTMSSPLQKFMVVSGGFIITLAGAWMTYMMIEKPSKKISSLLKYQTVTSKLNSKHGSS